MFHYMRFHNNGTGFHGVNKLIGKNVSHGCVRLTIENAKWLNIEFAEIGTEVIIREY